MSQSRSVWVEAARPKTLVAALVPVLVGSSLAFTYGSFLWLPTTIALLCAFLIQIGTNFANDYYDFIKGADNDDRIGFVRATAKGLVEPEKMKKAAFTTMILAFFCGLYLVWHGGWVILLIGILSIAMGIAYTGGPFPLGYNGLGDVFVFIFFGLIAVMGTFYINTLEWSLLAFWASLAVGALCVNILVINNLRDIETDKKTGKRTLGVLFGENALKMEYLFMLLIAFAIPPHFFVREGYGWQILIPFLMLPFAIKLVLIVFRTSNKSVLNDTLVHTSAFMLIFGVLFSVGLILGNGQ